MIPRDVLSNEEILEILLPFISFSIAETEDFKIASLNKLIKYINTTKRDIESIKESIVSATEFLNFINIKPTKLMHIIYLDSGFINSDFADKILKYALLGKLVNSKTKCMARDEILLTHPSVFRLTNDFIYGRIKHLLSDAGQFYMKTPEITLPKIVKSAKEFEETYRITDDKLKERYPFDLEAKIEIFLWDENKELLEKIRQEHIVV